MEIVKLGKIIVFKAGKKPKPLSNYVTSNFDDIPWIKISDIINNKLIKTKTFFRKSEISKTKLIQKGSLLMTSEGTVGIAFINEVKCAIDNHIFHIEPSNKIIKEYLYYWLIKNKKKIRSLQTGSVLQSISRNSFFNMEIFLPDIEQQQAIIDIIEPFEKIKEIYLSKKTFLLKIIENMYDMNSTNEKVPFNSLVNLIQTKYENQKYYVDTSSVGMSSFLSREKINVNRKSRANLTVKINSIIFSKMNGQNKIYPIYDKSLLENVYSTGFYNITSDNNLHIYGFLLSKKFVTQKTNASVGTLMSGLNLQSLNLININVPKENHHNDFFLKYLCTIDKIISKISRIIYLLMEKYIC